jgi:hypothetical protein
MAGHGGKLVGKWFKAGNKVPKGSRKAGERAGDLM